MTGLTELAAQFMAQRHSLTACIEGLVRDPAAAEDVFQEVWICLAEAAEKADLGSAWDGDADRCFFIDDTGAFVPGDFVTALLGEAFCTKVPGARIVYDVRASRAVADRVAAAPGPQTASEDIH